MEYAPLTTAIPARLDRLPWSRFHRLVVFALGITWILDGLEVTLKGAISGVLQSPETLGLSASKIGLIGSAYVLGAVMGSLWFGYLTDRLGRKRMFAITLVVYIAGVALTAFSWDVWSFAAFRWLTGAGIGGEYAAINSAVDELIPAKQRGRIDLLINGSYWIGAALASVASILLLNTKLFSLNVGWRVGFALGAVIGLGMLFVRRFIPESPRWLVVHGRSQEAEEIVAHLERQIEIEKGIRLTPIKRVMRLHPKPLRLKALLSVMLFQYRRRSLLGLLLMMSQAFLYNALFFTYAMILTNFYGISKTATGYYLLPFAAGNFFGPALLGRFFDSIGRKPMITMTYMISGLLLAVTGYLFQANLLSATGQTALWTIVFFFASAAASSAYLTISEIFPLEIRGLAIAIFFSLGTGIGGVIAPALFGHLIDTGSRQSVFWGYLAAAILMILTAFAELIYGVEAKQKSLEEIAPPLAQMDG